MKIRENPVGRSVPNVTELIKSVIDVIVHIQNDKGKRYITEVYFREFQEQFDLMAFFVCFVFKLFGLNEIPFLNFFGDFGVPVETAASEVVSDLPCRRKPVVPIHKKNAIKSNCSWNLLKKNSQNCRCLKAEFHPRVFTYNVMWNESEVTYR